MLSLLFETAYSGRAEFGLIGDDNITLKVSPDGSAWTTALTVNRSDGTAQFVAGSVSAPGVKIGDTDSGIYGAGSVLRFAIDGVQRGVLNQYGWALGEPADPTSTTGLSYTASAAAPSAGIATMQVRGEGAANNIAWLNIASAAGPGYSLRKGRGTIASPALPSNADTLGTIRWQADLTAGAVANGATLAAVVTEPRPSSSKMGTRLVLSLAPLGSATATEVVRVEADVGLSMFGANPVIDQNRLHVNRSYTVSTLPTPGTPGRTAYASNLRCFNGAGTQQGSGAGTGGLVVDNGTHWVNADAQSVTAVA